jgi:putative membrane protein
MLLTKIMLFLIAVLHIYFLILEMFLWTKPLGLKTFRMSLQKAQDAKLLAMNQGLYNGFLAVGLLIGIFSRNQEIARAFQLYSLGCVVVAGVFGAATVSWRIFMIQALPAIVGLGLVFFI